MDATDAPGIYIFDLLQAETNADLIVFCADSSTSNIQIRPVILYTVVSVTTTLASILADTGESQEELADGGRTDLILDSISANAALIPTML